MKSYLICTLIIWIFGVIHNMRELSKISGKMDTNMGIGASIVQIGFIIWATYLLANLN